MNIGERKSSVGESVNSEGIYVNAFVRDINGTRYTFQRSVWPSGYSVVFVYRGDESGPAHRWAGITTDIPGLMHFSRKLGELFKF